MAKHKPPKPTESFGHISFGKDGSVAKHIDTLPPYKEAQELAAIDFFKEGLKQRFPDFSICQIQQLPESGHDFLFDTSRGPITVQLTELVEREYARPLTRDEYGNSSHKEYILKESGGIPWGVDIQQRESALRRLIERKIGKHYAKGADERLWLVVFTTSSYYRVEYFQGEVLHQSQALLEARDYLANLQQPTFDEFWFTDLQTAPVRIWPAVRDS
jgi:hypothetical protein